MSQESPENLAITFSDSEHCYSLVQTLQLFLPYRHCPFKFLIKSMFIVHTYKLCNWLSTDYSVAQVVAKKKKFAKQC